MSKEERLKIYKQKEIYPKKPPLLEALSWLWRSRFVHKYTSQRDAEMYDQVARYYFSREKLARQIGIVFLENFDADPSQITIYDRAAGTGIITEALLDAGFKVCASDLSQDQLNKLKVKFENVPTVVEDLNGPMVTVADSSIDGMVEVAADRFMTAQGQEIFVKEAYRVLKKGGILVWPVLFGEYYGKLKHGWKWRAGARARIKLLQENSFKILSDDLKIWDISPASMCRLLIAKKE